MKKTLAAICIFLSVAVAACVIAYLSIAEQNRVVQQNLKLAEACRELLLANEKLVEAMKLVEQGQSANLSTPEDIERAISRIAKAAGERQETEMIATSGILWSTVGALRHGGGRSEELFQKIVPIIEEYLEESIEARRGIGTKRS